MSFREFTSNILSTRDYMGNSLEGNVISDIRAYLDSINAVAGKEKGFSLIILEKGDEVFHGLEGIGGYSGIMIRSPHYIGLALADEEPEIEFFGAYHMQSAVKKLYDMKLGSCWINIRNVSGEKKAKLPGSDKGSINYLLAFGMADEKAAKNRKPQTTVTVEGSSYSQDPYGLKVSEAAASDRARNSLEETVYLHEWGRAATLEDLESRGVQEIFYYVRNAPSYKNLQTCRLILGDGEAELAVKNPRSEDSYVDAGIMLYMLEGLTRDMGIPGKWNFIKDSSGNKEYSVVAKIEL